MGENERKERIKKPFYKRWWVWLLAAIIIIPLAFGGGDNEEVAEPPKEQDSTTTDEKATENDKDTEDDVKTVNIGQPLKVGDVTFTVNSLNKATNVGGQYGQNATGQYLILDVTLKNEGKEAITTDSSFFTLLQGDIKYEADTMATTYANEAGKGFFFETVNPGLEKKGKVVFDIPADAAGFTVQVQTGMFGTETGIINLE